MSKKSKKRAAETETAKEDEMSDVDLEKALAALSPEEQEMFVRALALAIKKRRLMLLGYLAALVSIIGGMIWALYIYGSREPGTFVGWVFLVPLAVAGSIFMFFGRLSRSIQK